VKKHTILYFIDEFGIGGTERQLALLLQQLDRNEFTPVLVLLREAKIINPSEINCDVYNLDIKSMLSYTGIKNLLHAIQLLGKLKPDVVHTYFIDSALIGVIIGLVLKVKCIITSRRDLGFWYTKRTLYMMRFIDSFTDKIVVNSCAIESVVRQYEKVKKEKITVIHNGIKGILTTEEINAQKRLTRQSLKVDDGTKIVGIVSNLNREVKRVDIFVKAAVQYLSKNKNVLFVVIGEGQLKDSLIKQSNSGNTSHSIRFLGSIKAPVNLICGFDLAVNTSETEGFSNSIIESMAHGVCTIATNNPGNAELIKDDITGVLFRVNDPEELEFKISELLENKEKRHQLGMNARNEVIKMYTAERMVRNHEELYKQIIAKRSNE
jgi:glycosyltransferase involved in cell wall biosynthesis